MISIVIWVFIPIMVVVVVFLEAKKKDITLLFLIAIGAVLISVFLELLKFANGSELMAEVAYLVFAFAVVGSGIAKFISGMRGKILAMRLSKKKV